MIERSVLRPNQRLRRTPTPGVLACTTLAVLGLCAVRPAALLGQESFESPPTLKASEELPPEMQKGERFVVQEKVHNDGFMNHYRVDSDFGPFEAYGSPALARLIQEIEALDQLSEISKSEVFLDSVKRSATGQVEAIQEFADHPVETVKGVPDGLKRSFRSLKRNAKEGYATAKDVSGEAADVVTGEDDDEGGDGDAESGSSSRSDETKELTGQASDATEAYAKKWFGVSAAERQWYQKLGVDPYTTNEVLRKEVKEMSRVDAAAGFGMRFAPIPQIPGASELATLNEVVWTTDPRELRDQNIKKLETAGVDDELITAFMNNPNYSPSMQTVLLSTLLELEGVDGTRTLLEIAARADAPEVARFHLENTQMLAKFHQNEEAFDRVLAGRVGAGVTRGGQLVTSVSVDYAFWDEELAGAVETFVESMTSVPAVTREVWIRGRASTRFKDEVAKRGWIAHDGT